MSRFAVLFALSLCLAGPAMACGMYIPSMALNGAFDAIDAQERAEREARQQALAINWVDEVGEVPLGSLPRLDRPKAERALPATARLAPTPHVPRTATPRVAPDLSVLAAGDRPDPVAAVAGRTPTPKAATVRAVRAEPATAGATDRVRALLQSFLDPGPAALDTADTAEPVDTGAE